MATEETTIPERQQTDESLRAERDKADHVIGEPTAIDEAADAVIEKARGRADKVLALARQQIDRRSPAREPGMHSLKVVEKERAVEDAALSAERLAADETVRAERTEHAAALAIEREETDKDLSRERARADDAVATRDEFLGVVSHDLRNMLGAVVGFAQLIEQEESRDNHSPTVVAFAQRICRTGGRMNRLIGDLVDLASIHAGSLAVTMEVGDVAAVVTEAAETFHAQAVATGVTLRVEVAAPLALLAFDAARILQVLANLLSNAFKFTPAGGNVVVRVERADNNVCISVTDDGIGIPSDKLDAIFERFLQVREDRRGVGLGLYISKCIVQGHGGRIWAESGIGKGSTFYFTIPAQLAP